MKRTATFVWMAALCFAQGERYAGPVYKAIAEGNLQSVSVAVASGARIRYAVAKGFANRALDVRATPDTVYPFGAVTNTFTAASVLKLEAEGKLRLDEEFERYLGGARIKGQEPKRPVTVRHVLAHASGLVDSREPVEMHYGRLAAVPAALLFGSVLLAAEPPATAVRYSNVGYGALGLAVELLAGEPLPDHIRKAWTEPLGLKSVSFGPSGAMQERLAFGYTRPEKGDPQPMGMFYHSPQSPMLGAGGLVGTAPDLARWAASQAGSQAVKEMFRVQFDHLRGRKWIPQSLFDSDDAGWGLGWVVWNCGGERCFAHAGSTPGYTAVTAGNLDRGTGVAVLTNSDSAHTPLARLAVELLSVAR